MFVTDTALLLRSDESQYINGQTVDLGMEAEAEDMGSAVSSDAMDLIDAAVAAASSNSTTTLKSRLLRVVAGVDRGVAAASGDVDAIEEAVQVPPSPGYSHPCRATRAVPSVRTVTAFCACAGLVHTQAALRQAICPSPAGARVDFSE